VQVNKANASATVGAPAFLNPVSITWGVLLLAWFVALCVIPDPRPLGAPEKVVAGLRSALGLSEPAARAVATIALRGVGLAVLAILLSLALARVRVQLAAPITIVGAPLLGVAAQWINYGYFPIAPQLRFGIVAAIVGALAGLVLRKSWIALVALVVISVGLFAWGTSTGVSDDLYEAARATGLHILENAEDTPDGDDGFAHLMQTAFTFAEDNSHGTNGVHTNKAAILALGVILGEEKVARVAKRRIDLSRRGEMSALRERITLRRRNDLARHFWVSAALAVLSSQKRSMTVGITKEMMDATPGGSGFSFVDLVADRAGTLFADAATKNAVSAYTMQLRVRDGVTIADFCPNIEGLPEGIPRDELQTDYGGLGGTKTNAIVADIQRRLATCSALQ